MSVFGEKSKQIRVTCMNWPGMIQNLNVRNTSLWRLKKEFMQSFYKTYTRSTNVFIHVRVYLCTVETCIKLNFIRTNIYSIFGIDRCSVY